ncbi:MAG TPA: hypothetical protein VNN10_15180 [Dehalococcoidia bacterium]|nr:hypothetical protein [Dehalococcoidia bacterium]
MRITSDRASVSGCSSVGIVSDDDLDDMRKKAARMGGDAVVLFAATPGARPGWFGPVITQVHTGEVYRCQR